MTSCHTQKSVVYSNDNCLSPLHAYNRNLESLCIQLSKADIDDTFMYSVSAHGQLVHVVLFVKSVTGEGVATWIDNDSPKFICVPTNYISFLGTPKYFVFWK